MDKKRVVAGVLAAVGMALLPTVAAQAAPADDVSVMAPTLELYTDYDYDTHWLHGGLVRYYTNSHNDLKMAGIGDSVSSLKNTTGSAWIIYEHQDRRGTNYCVRAGLNIPDMRARSFNDKMSSVERLNQSSCAGRNPW